MHIAIAGGTGFIGRALASRLLAGGHTVLLLTRSAEPSRTTAGPLTIRQWDARTPESLNGCLDTADAVINLTGESLAAKRWSNEQKARIVDSRVDATRALVAAMAGKRPRVFISVSGVGYYGSVESGDVTEAHHKGKGFLVAVTERWEKEAQRAASHGVRVVAPRLGLVLGRAGGAFPKMLLPFRMFVGGPLGSGSQWFPWVHIDDCAEAFLFVLKNEGISGPVNIAAPEAVTMEEFCRTLAGIMHRPCLFRVPQTVLRTVLGEMAEMLLTGQKAVPEKLLASGFRFRYPGLAGALSQILNMTGAKTG